MMEARTDIEKKREPIAWIEMKQYGDIDEVKQDLRELSERVGFEIIQFKTGKLPNSRNGNKIVAAYTDTFENIPKEKIPIVREWKEREIFWALHVCNANAKIKKVIVE